MNFPDHTSNISARDDRGPVQSHCFVYYASIPFAKDTFSPMPLFVRRMFVYDTILYEEPRLGFGDSGVPQNPSFCYIVRLQTEFETLLTGALIYCFTNIQRTDFAL